MAESAEHIFLKTNFLNIIKDFSNLDIYGFLETERKKFDLSCSLEQDFSRPLIGQTLWNHTRGIEKDLRTLFFDEESDIKVYMVKNNIKHQMLIDEIINDYKKSELGIQLFKLKTIWLPNNFDADNIKHQETIQKLLKDAIVNDILFNTVFGNLSASDIDLFLDVSGIPGLNLSILYEIATDGFLNYPDLLKRLHMKSTGPIREKIILLSSIGFLNRPQRGASTYNVSHKGKVFLDIIKRLEKELSEGTISGELNFILNKLNCPFKTDDEIYEDKSIFSKDNYTNLIRTVNEATKGWDIKLTAIDFFKTVNLDNN